MGKNKTNKSSIGIGEGAEKDVFIDIFKPK